MEILRLSLREAETWSACLAKLPEGSRDVYYTPEYYAANVIGQEAEAFCWVARDNGRQFLYPFFRRSVNALNLLPLAQEYYDIEGAYGYNGPLSDCEDPGFISQVYSAFAEFCQSEHIIAEFTRFHPLLENYRFAAPYMDTDYLHDTVYLDLTAGYEALWENSYDGKNRNMIRKARKNGVVCRLSEDWDGFRRLYEGTMQNLSATSEYFFPDEYYKALRRGFGQTGRSLLLEAVFEDRTIASLLLFIYESYAHYHLSARDPVYSRLAGVNVLLDYAVQTARENGATKMHLGGGMGPDDSLMRFKAGFSPLRGEFHVGKKVHDKVVYEAVCRAWAEKFPEKVKDYRHYLLRYRK